MTRRDAGEMDMNQEPMTEETKQRKLQRRAKLKKLGVVALCVLFAMGFTVLVKPDSKKPDIESLLIMCSIWAIFLAVGGLIIWQIKIPANLVTDEREKMILLRSELAGTRVAFFTVLLLGVTTLGICRRLEIDTITLRVSYIGFSVMWACGLYGVVQLIARWWLRR